MKDDRKKESRSLVPLNPTQPPGGLWVRKASEVRGPIGSFLFGLQVHANSRAVRAATEHLKIVGLLMDQTVETTKKMHRAQDAMRETAAREFLAEDLYDNETVRICEMIEEDHHQRALSARRRTKELLEAEQKVLEAKHSVEATKHFKPLKFKLGEVRARARQKDAEVDQATAEAATHEIEQKRRGTASKGDAVGEWLADRINTLESMINDGDADGEDTAELHVELQVLRRLQGRGSSS